MTGETHAAAEKALWRGHCCDAVRKFLMHAVVIDNQPVLGPTEIFSQTAKTATIVDDGMGSISPEHPLDVPKNERLVEGYKASVDENNSAEEAEKLEDEDPEAEDISVHDLNVREISDAFAEKEIACAFVFPSDENGNDEKKFSRIMAASVPADIVIIDWYLSDKNPALTKRVLTAIAKKDAAEKGRLRLICVYTGQTDIGAVTADSVAALSEGGLKSDKIDEDAGCAYGNHHCLLVLNKQDVHGAALPEKILDALTELSVGILPAFALAAVAAVRRNVHHIITRFSSDLDAAYVANRLITDPPSEVAELLRELFVSECDSAIGLEKVADNFLSDEKIKFWFANFGQPVTEFKFKTHVVRDTGEKEKKDLTIDVNFLCSLLSNGIKDDAVTTEQGLIKFIENKRECVSRSLHIDGNNSDGERKFARFAALKREAFGNTKLTSDEKWRPSLTLGTLLSKKQEFPASAEEGGAKTIITYYYCLTPACDTIRINGSQRNFLLLELEEAKKNANLIILEQDGSQKKLFINPKPLRIHTFNFKGDDVTGRVQATLTEEAGSSHPVFFFSTTGESPDKFLWIGEVRRNRANRDMAELTRNWLRFGIKDSEYLRLAGKGSVEI